MMAGLTVVSESLSRETHLRTDRPIRHKSWVILLDDEFYYVSWLSVSPCGDRPECAAFLSDECGRVLDWEELACCSCTDPRMALTQIVDQLRNGGDGYRSRECA